MTNEQLTTSERAYRVAYRMAYLLMSGYRFLRRPRTYGVQLILEAGSQILLVRHSYGHRTEWALPGGGRQRREDPLACARRELHEELGVSGAFRHVGVVELFHNYHDDKVSVFVVTNLSGPFLLDKIEINEAQWFGINSLPTNLTALAAHVLSKVLSNAVGQ